MGLGQAHLDNPGWFFYFKVSNSVILAKPFCMQFNTFTCSGKQVMGILGAIILTTTNFDSGPPILPHKNILSYIINP